MRAGILAVWLLLTSGLAPAQNPASAPASQPELKGVESLKQEAVALAPLVKSELAKHFLEATAELPRIQPRKLYIDAPHKTYIGAADYDALSADEKAKIQVVERDESYYFGTKHGSPLAYSRPIDLLGQAGLKDIKGKRVLDFGYGTVGHLRLLAINGADAIGVDVDPMLYRLYSEPGDQGAIKSRAGLNGHVTLVNGHWPTEESVRKAVGGNFDLIISKNTLKNGYIHPEQEVDPRMRIDLGVSDAEYVRNLYESLNPGGWLMIYNICPMRTPPGPNYIPWSDGHCPFAKEMLEKQGFVVLAFDEDDSPAMAAQGHALGWDSGPKPMDLKQDVYAMYTLARRKI